MANLPSNSSTLTDEIAHPSQLFEFQKRNNTMETKRNLCDVFVEETLEPRTCQSFLTKFCLGDFFLDDEPRRRRPSDAVTKYDERMNPV
ncbi:hypothetical protein TNCV_3254541 [Trichonephila clavipes]|nr:hypothetical protein TNCV_3254541 [Trichonephila clavipes]